MEHLLQKSKCFILPNIFKYMIFQRRQNALLWRPGVKLVNQGSQVQSPASPVYQMRPEAVVSSAGHLMMGL